MVSRDASTVVLHVGAVDGRNVNAALSMASVDRRVVEEKPLASRDAARALSRRLAAEGFTAVALRDFWRDRWEIEAAKDADDPVVDVRILDTSTLAAGGAARLAGRYRLGLPRFPAKDDTGRLVQSGSGSRCAMGVSSSRMGTSPDGKLAVVELVFSVSDVCDEVEGKVCSTFLIRL